VLTYYVMTKEALPAQPPKTLDIPAARVELRGRIQWPGWMRSQRVKQAVAIVSLVLVVAVPIVAGSLHSKSRSPEAIAAMVNGLPVSMASYKKQLIYATAGYTGPGAPGTSPTGQTVARLIADTAIQQAIAEVLIDNAARQHGVIVTDAALNREVTRMTSQAGGITALHAQMKAASMTSADLRWVARHNVLRDELAKQLHDAAWLDHLVGKAVIQYYVSDGAAAADKVPAVSLGHPAPPFVAKDLRGTAVSLANLRGKVVILNFWATWCGYCVQELPMLLQFAKAHPNFYVIALDHLESSDKVRAYVASHHLRGLTVWLDTTGDAFNNYLMTGLPATFFIDARGHIRSYNFGAVADASTLADQASHALMGIDNTYYNQTG
jgi:thiol-disulfide isomerase/thioredoxin